MGWNAGWWKFIPSSIAIVLVFWMAYPQSYRELLGLKLTKRLTAAAIVVGLITYLVASMAIRSILEPLGYQNGAGSLHAGWKYLSVFQVLNEEMLLRAWTLSYLSKILKGPIRANILASAVFALLHYVLYRLGSSNTELSFTALTSLFAFAVAANSIFFQTKSISIPYALHLGWNINKFGNDWISVTTSEPIPEALGFNLIEGNSMILMSALGLMLVCCFYGRISRVARGFRSA